MFILLAFSLNDDLPKHFHILFYFDIPNFQIAFHFELRWWKMWICFIRQLKYVNCFERLMSKCTNFEETFIVSVCKTNLRFNELSFVFWSTETLTKSKKNIWFDQILFIKLIQSFNCGQNMRFSGGSSRIKKKRDWFYNKNENKMMKQWTTYTRDIHVISSVQIPLHRHTHTHTHTLSEYMCEWRMICGKIK